MSRSPQVYLKLFITLARPLLEYASPVWNPQQVKLRKRLEAVQRRVTRRIPSIRFLSYPERLAVLNMDSLELRRRVADLSLVYKLVRLSSPSNNVIKIFTLASSSRTRGHRFKIWMTQSNRNTRKNFFSNRVVEDWNSLSSNIVNLNSLKSFRAAVRKELANR